MSPVYVKPPVDEPYLRSLEARCGFTTGGTPFADGDLSTAVPILVQEIRKLRFCLAWIARRERLENRHPCVCPYCTAARIQAEEAFWNLPEQKGVASEHQHG